MPNIPSDVWTYGTVVGLSPLQVQLDGESQPLAAGVTSLAESGVWVGARVRIHLHNRQIIIVGIVNGQPQALLDAIAADIAKSGTNVYKTASVPVTATTGAVWEDIAFTPSRFYVCLTGYGEGAGSMGNWTQITDGQALSLAEAAAVSVTQDNLPDAAKVGDLWHETGVTPALTYICTTEYASGFGSMSNWTLVDFAARQIAVTANAAATGAAATAATANATATGARTAAQTATGLATTATQTATAASATANTANVAATAAQAQASSAYAQAQAAWTAASAATGTATTAQQAATAAAADSATKATLIVGPNDPGGQANRSWIDTSTSPATFKTWNTATSGWVKSGDTAATSAAAAATGLATTANQTATAASATAATANATATGAASTATNALTTAQSATGTAGSALTAAQSATGTATSALTAAKSATGTATTALTTAQSATGAAATKWTTYPQSTPPANDDNGLWIDTAHGNLQRILTRRNALALVYGGGYHEQNDAASRGWNVTTVTVTAASGVPSRATIAGYDLLIVDAGYSGINNLGALVTAIQNAWTDGVSLFTTGNDTTSISPLFTGTASRTPSGIAKTNIIPATGSASPVAQGWAAFADSDANLYLTGVNAAASVVGTTNVNGVDQPMIAVMEDPTTGARWVHNEAYTNVAAFNDAAYTWLRSRWRPVQDQGIPTAQATATGAATAAASATGLATTAQQTATGAVSTANGALTASQSATGTASNALTAAASATGTATGAATAAASATGTASSALTAAQSATGTASNALTAAQSATGTASGAATAAASATGTAGSALTAAQSATGTATSALTAAQSATGTAGSALTAAASATGTANSALTAAASATGTAASATTAAASATGLATTAQQTATGAQQSATTANQAASGAQTTANQAMYQLSNLSVADLQAGVFQVDIQLAKSLAVNSGNGTLNSIVITPQDGITIKDASNNPLVILPTDPKAANYFRGQIIADGLTTTGKASFTGTQNEISQNSMLTLQNGVTAPATAAAVTRTTAATGMPDYSPVASSGAAWYARGWQSVPRDGANGLFVAALYAQIDSNGNLLGIGTSYSSNRLTTAPAYTTSIYSAVSSAYGSVFRNANLQTDTDQFTQVGTTCYLLRVADNTFSTDPSGYATGTLTLHVWTSGATTGSTYNLGTAPTDSNGSYSVGKLATDGTTVYHTNFSGNGGATPTLYTIASNGTRTTVGALPSSVATDFSANKGIVTKGTFDRGAAYYIYQSSNATYFMAVSGLTIAAPTNSSPIPGNLWDNADARFYQGMTGASATKFSKNTDLSTVWVKYTWYNASTAHETTLGTGASITPTRYYGLSISRPVPPTAGAPGDVPQTAKVYMARGATVPADTAFTGISGDTGSGTPIVTLDIVASTGTAAPTGNGFPNGNSGVFMSAQGGFIVKGDGSGDWPVITNRITALENKAATGGVIAGPYFKGSLRAATANAGNGIVWYDASGATRVDNFSGYDSTNHGYRIPFGGIYRVTIQIKWNSTAPSQIPVTQIYVNGTMVQMSPNYASTAAFGGYSISWSGQLNSGDLVQHYNGGGAYTTQVDSGDNNFMIVEYVGSGAVPAAANADSGWITVGSSGAAAFANGWTHFDARTAQYRKIGNMVYLRGIIKSGTIGSAAFILPTGFRPVTRATWDQYFSIVSNGAFGVVTINGDGQVVAQSPATNAWVTLDNIRFFVD